MRKLIATASLAVGLTGSAAAADFTGPLAPAAWTIANTGTLLGGSPTLGSATFSTTQLVLTSSNFSGAMGDTPSCVGGAFQVAGPCQLQVTASVPGTYSFAWSYLTADTAGPGGDLFGVIVDSSRILLSDPGGGNAQSGARTFAATSSFGWFMNCTDCIGGSATATISQFDFTAGVIPEPETYALVLAGLLGVMTRSRRRSRALARATRRESFP